MKQFGTEEVSRLADIPVRSLRAMVRARHVFPARGPRNSLRFSFHDLVLLRTARSLLAAGIPQRRVGQALRTLRLQLPAGLPARALSVIAAGGQVVVQEAGEKQDVLTGELLLAFEVRVDGQHIELVDASPPPDGPGTASGDATRAGDDDCDLMCAVALNTSG